MVNDTLRLLEKFADCQNPSTYQWILDILNMTIDKNLDFVKIRTPKIIKSIFNNIRDLVLYGQLDSKGVAKSTLLVGPVLPYCPFQANRLLKT